MDELSLVLAYALTFGLVVVTPLSGILSFETLRLRLAANPNARLPLYKKWAVEIAVTAALALLIFVTSGDEFAHFGFWTPNFRGLHSVLLGAALGATVGLFTGVIAWRRKAARTGLPAHLSVLLPGTRTEKIWFLVLSLCAGIGEEIVYRGFLIMFLHEVLPVGTYGQAIGLAAFIFAIGHAYAGGSAVAITGVIGVFLGIIFVATGSLIPGIIYHALADARLVLVKRPEDATPDDASSTDLAAAPA